MTLLRRRGVLLFVLLAVAIALPPYCGTYYTRFATQIAIYGMAALSVDLLLGYSGLITFGQAALFGVGAYAAGMLTVYGLTDALVAWPLAVLVSMLFALAIGALSLRTRVGALIRAGSDNREIVAALGININLLYTLIFALSAMLAALAGIMMGPLLSVEPGAGDPILILALVVVVIGGIGSVRGALVGALMVGIFDTLSRVLIPLVVQTNATSALVGMAVYVLMAVVLLFSRTSLFAAHRG